MLDVVINIKSRIMGDDESAVEFTTVGKMLRKEESWQLLYDESEMLEKNTKTILKITDDNVVSITRTGGARSKLIISEGRRYSGEYFTTVGVMNVGVSGTKVKSSITENGGKIELDYNVDINAEFTSRNQIEITIRKE